MKLAGCKILFLMFAVNNRSCWRLGVLCQCKFYKYIEKVNLVEFNAVDVIFPISVKMLIIQPILKALALFPKQAVRLMCVWALRFLIWWGCMSGWQGMSHARLTTPGFFLFWLSSLFYLRVLLLHTITPTCLETFHNYLMLC